MCGLLVAKPHRPASLACAQGPRFQSGSPCIRCTKACLRLNLDKSLTPLLGISTSSNPYPRRLHYTNSSTKKSRVASLSSTASFYTPLFHLRHGLEQIGGLFNTRLRKLTQGLMQGLAQVMGNSLPNLKDTYLQFCW